MERFKLKAAQLFLGQMDADVFGFTESYTYWDVIPYPD